MKRGEIYVVDLEPTLGHEQQGKRPVVVVSPKEFNHVIKTPIVLPITTKGNFIRTAGFAVSLDSCSTYTKGVIRCDQPRAIDMQARGGKYVESIPSDIIEIVLAKIMAVFD